MKALILLTLSISLYNCQPPTKQVSDDKLIQRVDEMKFSEITYGIRHNNAAITNTASVELKKFWDSGTLAFSSITQGLFTKETYYRQNKSIHTQTTTTASGDKDQFQIVYRTEIDQDQEITRASMIEEGEETSRVEMAYAYTYHPNDSIKKMVVIAASIDTDVNSKSVVEYDQLQRPILEYLVLGQDTQHIKRSSYRGDLVTSVLTDYVRGQTETCDDRQGGSVTTCSIWTLDTLPIMVSKIEVRYDDRNNILSKVDSNFADGTVVHWTYAREKM